MIYRRFRKKKKPEMKTVYFEENSQMAYDGKFARSAWRKHDIFSLLVLFLNILRSGKAYYVIARNYPSSIYIWL